MRNFLIVCFVMNMATLAGFAQPSSGGPAPQEAEPTAVPLDGGVSVLLAGGVAYSLRHLRKRRARS